MHTCNEGVIEHMVEDLLRDKGHIMRTLPIYHAINKRIDEEGLPQSLKQDADKVILGMNPCLGRVKCGRNTWRLTEWKHLDKGRPITIQSH